MSSTKFNIKDAAKLYGMSRNTIYKALQEGRLSKNTEGMLEFVELLRVFGEPVLKTQKTVTTEIVYNEEELRRYMRDAVKVSNESPVCSTVS